MIEKQRRVVLAFYTGDESYASQAFRALCSIGAKVWYFQTNGEAAEGSAGSGQPYSSLRLSGEELLAADVEPSTVPAIVKTLRTAVGGNPVGSGTILLSDDAGQHRVSVPIPNALAEPVRLLELAHNLRE